MPRRTVIEAHPERVAIELSRLAGVTLDKVAARFGVTRDAVHRHMARLTNDYKASLLIDIPRDELLARATEESGLLLDHFKMVRNIVERQLIEAKACGDSHAVARLGNAALSANTELGRLTGEIERFGKGVSINNTAIVITERPEWRELTAGLLDIAVKFPDAKGQIVSLIRRVKETSEAPPPLIEGAAIAA